MRPTVTGTRILALVALTAFMSFGTSSLVRTIKARSSDDETRPRGTTTVTTSRKGPQAVADVLPDAHTVSSGGTKRLTAEARGRTVRIEALVTLFERRENAKYLWTLTIRKADGDRAVILDRVYDQQVFTPPLGRFSPATFQEQCDLDVPDGKFVAELFACRLEPGMNLGLLQQPQQRRGLSVAGGSCTFTIPGAVD